MTLRLLRLSGLLTLLWGALFAARAGAGPPPLPREVARIELPGVQGRIDHLALDAPGQRLFVAALGSGSIEVVDLAQGRRVARLEGFREPQGLFFLPEPGRLFVTEGAGTGLAILDGNPLTRSAIVLPEDADNIRYEAGARRLWVGAGGGRSGALAAVDPDRGKVVSRIALDAHPESFQLEAGGPRIFVNVPGRQEVQVVDRERRQAVARWSLPYAANFPMALDEGRGRLFVGCRRPARLLVLDGETGRLVAELDSPGDADDIFVDSQSQRVYVSAGEGLLRVYTSREGDRFEAIGDVATGPGARTSLLVPELHRLYVAVPARGQAPARVLVFDTAP